MRRYLAQALCGLVVSAPVFVFFPRSAAAQKPQRVELPEGTVLSSASKPAVSADGSVGFVAPAVGDTLVAFALRTGEVLGHLEGLGNATAISLHETGAKRVVLLTVASADQSTVVVVDASDPSAMAATAFFRLGEGLEIAPGAGASMARGEKYAVVPISKPFAALVSFDVETGEQIGALTLDGAPDRISVSERADASAVAVSSAESNKVALVTLSDEGVLLPLSTFALPEDAPISAANNVVFDASGKVGYVASLRGHALMSFSVETGELVDRLETQGSSAGLTVYHTATDERIAVTNVSRPGGAATDEDVAPKADEPPLGLPGAVVVASDPTGKLAERSRFYPDTGEELAPANNAEFNADGSSVIVPARTGSLYIVDAATGKTVAREGLENRIQSIAAAPLSESVAVLSAGGSEGHIDIVPTTPPAAETSAPETGDATDRVEPRRDADKSGKDDEGKGKDKEDKADATPPSATRVSPATVQAGRRRDLPVAVIGSGFRAGATVVIGDTQYSAVVGPNGKRANFTLPASLLGDAAQIAVAVRNPDGTLSNAVSIQVVTPFAPIITRTKPKKIFSTNEGDGVDVTVLGDHFRDGAVARVTYTDHDGTQQTQDLKTYRLSFTTIVAHLPRKLVRRATDYSLTVVDRDGETASAPAELAVVGPSVAKIVPESLVAGDVDPDETLFLHVAGENFHPDAVVYVRRPTRGGDDDTAPFVGVPSANVVWKDSEKIVVRLTGADVAYAGDLVVRVVNPVSGEKRRNGDAADKTVAVAGPVVESAAPTVVLAGSDAFVLKLTGTDFRRSSFVKIAREGGGQQTQKRVVVVDDPKFKDRKLINVQMNTEDLLRLVAKPGTLNVRVITPNGASGAPSPTFMVQVVAPGILSTPTLMPNPDDDAYYRLKIEGQYFAEGAVVQLYDATGAAVGKPIDAKVKDDATIVALVSRRRVTELRTFKVVVINPGGPYNASGVPSNPIDVTAN